MNIQRIDVLNFYCKQCIAQPHTNRLLILLTVVSVCDAAVTSGNPLKALTRVPAGGRDRTAGVSAGTCFRINQSMRAAQAAHSCCVQLTDETVNMNRAYQPRPTPPARRPPGYTLRSLEAIPTTHTVDYDVLFAYVKWTSERNFKSREALTL